MRPAIEDAVETIYAFHIQVDAPRADSSQGNAAAGRLGGMEDYPRHRLLESGGAKFLPLQFGQLGGKELYRRDRRGISGIAPGRKACPQC